MTILKCFISKTLARQIKGWNIKSRQHSTHSLEDIKQSFSQFKGGTVTLSKDYNSGIAKICVSNPGKRNSFTGEMMVALADTVSELEQWQEGKAVILYGGDGFFCSGADLNMVKVLDTPDHGMQIALLMHDTLTRFHNLPLLSVALIQGKALGGGAEVTTACDFRLMKMNSEVQFVHMKMGLVPGWGGATRLVRLMGDVVALDLLTSCKKLTSQEALKIGFANAILESNDPVGEATEWLKMRTIGSTEVLRAAKNIVVHARNLPLKESLQKERKIFMNLWGGPANKKALGENIKH